MQNRNETTIISFVCPSSEQQPKRPNKKKKPLYRNAQKENLKIIILMIIGVIILLFNVI